MQVEVSPAEEGKARLHVTLTAEEVGSVIDSTYQRVAQRVRVAGFRPGKAPRQLVLRTYGEEDFYHRATDELFRRWYPLALAESGVEAIDQGELESTGEHEHVRPGQAFSFSALVATKPEINLPDYEEMKIPAPSTEVTDAEVDKVLDAIRSSRATLEPVPSRPAQIGDVVKMNIHGRSQGEEVLSQDDFDFELVDETDQADPRFPGLSKELVGARPGDIRDVVLSLPPDYREQELAGESLSLKIVVKEVQRKILPELTDDFAKEVSSAESVSALREMIRHNLEHEKLDEATGKVSTEVVDALIARSNLQAPEILVEEEQDRMLREHRRYFERQDLKFDQFLMAARKSEDEYRSDLRPAAERSVKRDLILDAVAEAENLEPDPRTVDEEVRQMSEAVSNSERDVERLTHSPRLHATVADEMRRRMALTKLVEITSGLKPLDHDHDGPQGDPTEEAETAPEAESAPVAAEAPR